MHVHICCWSTEKKIYIYFYIYKYIYIYKLQNKFILSSLSIHLRNAVCKLNAGKKCCRDISR